MEFLHNFGRTTFQAHTFRTRSACRKSSKWQQVSCCCCYCCFLLFYLTFSLLSLPLCTITVRLFPGRFCICPENLHIVLFHTIINKRSSFLLSIFTPHPHPHPQTFCAFWATAEGSSTWTQDLVQTAVINKIIIIKLPKHTENGDEQFELLDSSKKNEKRQKAILLNTKLKSTMKLWWTRKSERLKSANKSSSFGCLNSYQIFCLNL